MGAGQGSEVNKSFVSPTQSKRGPRMHSLTPSLSVYTFLNMPPHVSCLSDNVFLHPSVKSKKLFNLSSIQTKMSPSLFCPFTQNIVCNIGLFC